MKKLFAVATMLVTMAGAASAQGGGGGGGGGRAAMTPEQQVERTMGRLFKDITLNDAQKAKATEVIKKTVDARMAITDRQSPEGMTKSQELTKKQNEDLKALLTSDDDKKKFDDNAAAGGRRGGF